MAKRPIPTSRFAFRGKETETGCSTVLFWCDVVIIIGAIIISAVIIIVCAVALVLFLARVFGLWPDWALEVELVFREAWKAWLR